MVSFLSKIRAATVPNVYHGSPVKFNQFKLSNQGKNYGSGIYFTESKSEAADYTNEGHGYIYTVELEISKPFDVRNKTDAKLLAKSLQLDWNEVIKDQSWSSEGTGFESFEKNNLYLKLAGVLGDKLEKEGGRWYHADEKIHKAMHSLGFDSIHDNVRKWWVVFEPQKIKIIRVTKQK